MAHDIDCTQIPKVEANILSRTLLDAMTRFYKSAANQRRFEAWLASAEGQAYISRTVPSSVRS